LAGGLSSDADESSINLAALLVDGQKIVVPYNKSEITPVPVAGNNGKTASPTQVVYPININLAPKEELTFLPGIGDLKAEAIVKYREQKGPFNTIEDLQNVTGIGPGIFSKIKELIIVK
jgi:competence protein ComEA